MNDEITPLNNDNIFRPADDVDADAQLQKELDEIRRLSSSVIETNEQNKQLRKRLIDNELSLDELKAENGRLAARSNREWFVIGALVVIFGIGIGLILPRIRWRRKSRWGEL